jgi:hypothetical protein
VSFGPLFDFSASASEPHKNHAIATLGANAGTECLADEFRRVCEDAGIKPDHHKAWGSLTNQLVKAAILMHTGRLGKSTSVLNHTSRQPIWRVR